MSRLMLVDGHSLAYRAFFALPLDAFSTSKGELTNAVYGFALMLLKALEEERPEYIAVTFDAGKETFRHREFKEYKAQRAKMPDELRTQMARIREVVESLGIPIFEVEGYEADDLIGTLARQAEDKGVETVVLTGDTDALQLVSPLVEVLTPGGRQQRFSEAKLYDKEAILERYGIEPSLLVDLKALVGDKSDNIPGVRGIGEKTALALIKRFGPMEEIYEHLNEVEPERARRALADQEDIARLSKHLATVVTQVPIALDLAKCRVEEYDREQATRVFRELEFRSLVDRLPETEKPRQLTMFSPESRVGPESEIVTQLDALEKLLVRLSEASHMTLDVETTGIDAMSADLVGLALAIEAGKGYYIPLGHTAEAQLPLKKVASVLKTALENERIAKYAHNAIYDLALLARHGMRVRGLAFDTMIAAYLLDPGGRGLGLKEIAWRRLGVEMTPISHLIGKGKAQGTMAEVPIATAGPYAVADVDATERLVPMLEKELKEYCLWDLFVQVEMPLVEVLLDMEMAGVALDVDYLKGMSRELYQRVSALEEEIQRTVGHPLNVNSPQQLSAVLYGELKLPPKDRTKTGYSTSAEVLEELESLHPVVGLILEHRQLSKLKSTYVDALPLLVNRRTGRVHTSYNQTGTVTGRLSSSEPNLQNIPVRTEIGRQVRRAFIAEPGKLLIAADYSQVELRILAHVSQDPQLLAAFHRGEDIHASTAASVLGVPIAQVTSDMRRIAKTVNFGLIYGMGDYGLAQRTGLSQTEAAEFIESYFARYPKVKEYLEDVKRKAREEGYISTVLGRRRYFPELHVSSDAHMNIKRAAERMAVNMPIQGSAADIIKIAMIRLHKALREKGLKTQLTLQVHDELVLEAPEDEVKTAAPMVRSIMEEAYNLGASLRVDLKVGKNWEEMRDYEA